MNWFFFGSLMDQQVMEIVAGRTVLADEMITADLPGYRRVRVADETTPALVHTPGHEVEGVLIESLDATEALRIMHFEGEDYRAEEVQLRLKNQKPVSAFCFLATEQVALSDESWELDRWQREHRDAYLHVVEEHMASYGQ